VGYKRVARSQARASCAQPSQPGRSAAGHRGTASSLGVTGPQRWRSAGKRTAARGRQVGRPPSGNRAPRATVPDAGRAGRSGAHVAAGPSRGRKVQSHPGPPGAGWAPGGKRSGHPRVFVKS
jgi:hypothetical protein